MKKWYLSKTMWFNLISTVVPFLSLAEWRVILPSEMLPYWMLAVALGNVYLRTVTSKGVEL